jgi:predicted dehydrogenase
MRALIVGLGFGKAVYKPIYENLGWDIVTVDSINPEANFKFISEVKGKFNVAHICTPNFTHYELADAAAKISKIVFVEKPGVKTAAQWQQLLDNNPKTRIVMTKNNQYRDNIMDMARSAAENPDENVNIDWVNKNRVPNPGSWFTTKELAFGGVSRDLMPHMLSIYQMLNPNWLEDKATFSRTYQNWGLSQIDTTDYGVVNKQGTYDVDDACTFEFGRFHLYANWRSVTKDEQVGVTTSVAKYPLGLCPVEAYERMIKTAIKNQSTDKFWEQQKEMDLWIHQQLELV